MALNSQQVFGSTSNPYPQGYSYQAFTMATSGGVAVTNVNCYAYQDGTFSYLTIPQINLASAGSQTTFSLATLPAQFLPQQNQTIPVVVVNNNLSSVGWALVQTSGTIVVTATSNFTGSVCGMQAMTLVYV